LQVVAGQGQIERLLPPRLNGSSRFRKRFLAVDVDDRDF
jgi:hypothetical protein